jgi:hypothetical protein
VEKDMPQLLDMEKCFGEEGVPKAFTKWANFVAQYGHITGNVIVYVPDGGEKVFRLVRDVGGSWVPNCGSVMLGPEETANWAEGQEGFLREFNITYVGGQLLMSVVDFARWSGWATGRYYDIKEGEKGGSVKHVLYLVNIKPREHHLKAWEEVGEVRDVKYQGRFCFTHAVRHVTEESCPDLGPRFYVACPIPGVTFTPWHYDSDMTSTAVHLQLNMTSIGFNTIWTPENGEGNDGIRLV